MSDQIRAVYDKYRNEDGSLRDYHYVVAGGPEDRQDFIDDAWLAIRAHIDARCVWRFVSPFWYAGCDDGRTGHVEASGKFCPYCGAPLVRKEADGV